MRAFLLDLPEVVWRERGVIALPFAVVSLFMLGGYLIWTPVETMSIWIVAGLATALTFSMAVFLSAANRAGSAGGDVMSGAGGGSDSGCGGGDGGGC